MLSSWDAPSVASAPGVLITSAITTVTAAAATASNLLRFAAPADRAVAACSGSAIFAPLVVLVVLLLFQLREYMGFWRFNPMGKGLNPKGAYWCLGRA